MESYYRALMQTYASSNKREDILAVLCCKWDEMKYISTILKALLAYIVHSSSPVHDL